MNEHVRQPRIVRSTQAAEGVPRWRWTLEDLLALVRAGVLSENEKIELIGGEIVPMSPKGRRYEVVADELAQYWGPHTPPEAKVSVERQFNLDEATYTDPDLLVRPAHIKSYDVRGDTALLVVEVADSSLSYDTKLKARVYASFGVREYWVIDAVKLTTRVHRAPGASGYGDVQNHGPEARLAPLLVPALAVRLADIDFD